MAYRSRLNSEPTQTLHRRCGQASQNRITQDTSQLEGDQCAVFPGASRLPYASTCSTTHGHAVRTAHQAHKQSC